MYIIVLLMIYIREITNPKKKAKKLEKNLFVYIYITFSPSTVVILGKFPLISGTGQIFRVFKININCIFLVAVKECVQSTSSCQVFFMNK